MLEARSRQPSDFAAWRRAVTAHEHALACAETGALRLAASASRLEHTTKRLNESEHRVSRGRIRATDDA